MAADDRTGDRHGQALIAARTIFALSSGAPPAAIAVLRISGPDAGAAMDALTQKVRPKPRRAVLRRLYHPAGGTELDSALVLWMPGPASATGEDLVELHLHGGRAVVAAVEGALGELPGLIPAEPGAFTRRAFENGRIDLSQAEGLGDLLESETEGQRRAALAMAEGGLRRLVADWQGRLIDLAASVESLLDFSDEADVSVHEQDIRSAIAGLAGEIARRLADPPAERLRDGVRVAIAGPPNAGKSTLLNMLAGRDAAITSDIPGTTRDIVEVLVRLRGVPILLTDTAGLRDDSADVIEKIGIGRAQSAIARSDILLWLGDAATMPTHAQAILVANKSDLVDTPASPDAISISALTGLGIEALIDRVMATARALLPTGDTLALSAHQRAALAASAEALRDAAIETDLILVAENLRRARAAWDRITGMADVETVLDALFARFCIGK